jgi:dihydroorotate dehydrogenase
LIDRRRLLEFTWLHAWQENVAPTVVRLDYYGMRPHLLPPTPDIAAETLLRIGEDHDRFAVQGLPGDLDRYLRESYGLDMSATYAGIALRNPWGKASGQLSLNRASVEEAAEAGLGLVVLKTVIAEDRAGDRAMSAWAIKESQMAVERIEGSNAGEIGWTVTWNGRGWWESFDLYLELVRSTCAIGRASDMVVVPSVKYHLPQPGESLWRTEEYQVTTRALLDAYQCAGGVLPMPLEKDFSPTLAGSDRAAARNSVIEWIARVPGLIRAALSEPEHLRVGLKLFNSLENDEFQHELLALAHRGPGRADFLVYANRLFNPHRVFEGNCGVAFGGPDLSSRNLRILSALRLAEEQGAFAEPPLEISATGDISSGRIAVEYALRGCTSFQIHTLFQLPASEYAMRVGTKVQRALHRLYFDPLDGFIVWALHAARRLNVSSGDGTVSFLELARRGARSALTRGDLDPESS